MKAMRRRAGSSIATSAVVHHVQTTTSQSRAAASATPSTGTAAPDDDASGVLRSTTTALASQPSRSRSVAACVSATWIPPDGCSVGRTNATRIGATIPAGVRTGRRLSCTPCATTRRAPLRVPARRSGERRDHERAAPRARRAAAHRGVRSGAGARRRDAAPGARRHRGLARVAAHRAAAPRACAPPRPAGAAARRGSLGEAPPGALMPTVTVAIPVLDGARYLDEVLTAVRAQEVDRPVELLIWDSGSTDGSLEIAARHGARIHHIPKHEFSHGGTRNRMAAMAEGDHIAFLTQDATPASPRWLAALLEGFTAADDVAAVFGAHIPRPDASHMIKCEMERHFATWGGGRAIDVQRLDRSPAGLAAYRRFPGRWTFLSDVNCAVARWALERRPYREVPYAEDQLLGRELIEAGYAKVFHPDAAVVHSHDYPPAQFLRRYFDEFRSLREVLDHVEPAGAMRNQRFIRGVLRADQRWLQAHGVHGRRLVRPLAVSARHHAIRQAGAILGSRADRLPPAVRRRLSLEGRDSFRRIEIEASPLLG